MRRMRCFVGALAVGGLALTGCSSPPDAGDGSPPASRDATATPPPTSPQPGTGSSTGPMTGPATTGSPPPGAGEATSPGAEPSSPEPSAGLRSRGPTRFDGERAMRTVRLLAGEIGPRSATGPAFRRAAVRVEQSFEELGYDVRRQRFPVPGGNSWGVPVRPGQSWNVIATAPGFSRTQPHLVIGAHLDTVPQAPGAEDNASGVAVLLELARLSAQHQPPLPVVFVAFGAEEPRGPADDQHHFGSTAMVRRMGDAERRAVRGMVALDRVGVGTVVPLHTGGRSPTRLRDQLAAAARRLDIPITLSQDNRASDHWSFEKAGFTVARMGSTPYGGYHSAGDVPSVVDQRQLVRVGRVAWEWLRSR